ncbi:MAG: RNA polymerase sigma factor [Acidimicrobiales bacterium]
MPEIPVLLRVARSLTRHDADAEDLVQDTLLRAYRGIEGFDGRHPRAWVLTILRNTHLNRGRRRRPELLRHPEQAEQADTADADAPTLVDHELDAAVEAALEALPARFRAIVDLVDIEGLTYAEAAARLNVPVGTVMSRLHRARRRIRAQLERAGLGIWSTT